MKTNLKLTFAYIVLGLSLQTQALASEPSIVRAVLETEPRPFQPTLIFEQVYGPLSDVTKVTLEIPSASLSLPLESIGNRSWEIKLSPQEVQKIRQVQSNGPLTALLKIESKNSKGRTESKSENVQIGLTQQAGSVRVESPDDQRQSHPIGKGLM